MATWDKGLFDRKYTYSAHSPWPTTRGGTPGLMPCRLNGKRDCGCMSHIDPQAPTIGVAAGAAALDRRRCQAVCDLLARLGEAAGGGTATAGGAAPLATRAAAPLATGAQAPGAARL